MRIGVISDIHANGVALDAALADLDRHPVDRVVCLGDVLQGGPQPAEVAARMRDLDCPVILGNADAFLIDEPEPDEPEHMLTLRDWTRERLGTAVTSIETFVPTLETDGLLCFHGSPRSYDEVLLPETPDAKLMDALGDATIQCGGHTHLQWTRTVGDKTFFNPGSVGLAYNRHQPRETFRFSPWAEYAIFSDGAIEFCKVAFDVDALKDAYRENGHPFADRYIAQY